MTLSNRPSQFTRCSETSYFAQSSHLPNLPEDLLGKIANLSGWSKVDLQVTCKQVDAALQKVYKKASCGQMYQRHTNIPPFLGLTKYTSLKEFVIAEKLLDQKEKIVCLVQSFPSLLSFKIESSTCIDDILMNSLQSLANLKTIHLDSCAEVSSLALRQLIVLQKTLQNLCLKEGDFEDLQDIFFSNLSNLESLELCDSRNLNDQMLGKLLAVTSSLKILKIVGVPPSSGSAFAKLSSSKLIELKIEYSDDYDNCHQKYKFDSILALLQKNTELESLHFSGYYATNMFESGHLNRHRAQLDNVKRLILENVDLDEMNNLMCLGKSVEYLYLFRPSAEKEQNYAPLLGYLTSLRTLKLECCRNMMNRDFSILTKKTNKLTTICVDRCSNELTGKAFTSIDLSQVRKFTWKYDGDSPTCIFATSDLGDAIRQMPLLEKFHFEGDESSEDENFGELINVFKNLKSLKFHSLHQLTNRVFEDMIFDAINLEEITLIDIKKLTNEALLPMIFRCHKLKKIRINCSNISKQQVENLQSYIDFRNSKANLKA